MWNTITNNCNEVWTVMTILNSHHSFIRLTPWPRRMCLNMRTDKETQDDAGDNFISDGGRQRLSVRQETSATSFLSLVDDTHSERLVWGHERDVSTKYRCTNTSGNVWFRNSAVSEKIKCLLIVICWKRSSNNLVYVNVYSFVFY